MTSLQRRTNTEICAESTIRYEKYDFFSHLFLHQIFAFFTSKKNYFLHQNFCIFTPKI